MLKVPISSGKPVFSCAAEVLEREPLLTAILGSIMLISLIIIFCSKKIFSSSKNNFFVSGSSGKKTLILSRFAKGIFSYSSRYFFKFSKYSSNFSFSVSLFSIASCWLTAISALFGLITKMLPKKRINIARIIIKKRK